MHVEEVPDEEPQVHGGVLGEGAELLMTEQEYEDTLKLGQGPIQQKNDRKLHRGSTGISAREQNPSKSLSEQATKGLYTMSSRRLQDRPILQQQYEWYYGLQMSCEWNEMVAVMQSHEMSHVESAFRIADLEEIFKPQRFKHLYCDSKGHDIQQWFH